MYSQSYIAPILDELESHYSKVQVETGNGGGRQCWEGDVLCHAAEKDHNLQDKIAG